MRGQGYRSGDRTDCGRITPAHAGTRMRTMSYTMRGKDHPRTCGDKGSDRRGLSVPPGSPPHMRGQVCSSSWRSAMRRITPAHAGTRTANYRQFTDIKDHPRTCGDKSLLCMGIIVLLGSPPHMRGQAIIEILSLSRNRITPAHAGTSFLPLPPRCSWWDHPRACGDKVTEFLSLLGDIGSPPRMRGQVLTTLWRAIRLRITPAHAGTSIP